MSMEYKEALKVVQEDVERLGELKEACEVIMTLYDVAENSYHEGLEDGQMVCDEKWIPAAKKQPKVEGEYLITVCVEAPMCRTLYKITIGSWRVEKGWYHETYPGCVAKYYVLAWMPLPEPYKEGEDESASV